MGQVEYQQIDRHTGGVYNQPMQVFISHTKRDRQLAVRLSAELKTAGVDCWTDDQIYPGDNWAKLTGQALEQSDVMIALVTQDALESGPLKEDVQFALTSNSYGGRVVPILVGMRTFEAGKGVPWILLRLNPVFLDSADSDLQEVVERVRSVMETVPHAAG
jgi:hypothetical protein